MGKQKDEKLLLNEEIIFQTTKLYQLNHSRLQATKELIDIMLKKEQADLHQLQLNVSDLLHLRLSLLTKNKSFANFLSQTCHPSYAEDITNVQRLLSYYLAKMITGSGWQTEKFYIPWVINSRQLETINTSLLTLGKWTKCSCVLKDEGQDSGKFHYYGLFLKK